MPTYKLTYFNMMARAEVARWLFAKAGVPYEDERIPFNEWGPLKEQMPYGSMPVLTLDGKQQIGQSNAINFYLAKKFGLHGKTDVEEAIVNSICFACEEVGAILPKLKYSKDEAEKAALRKTLAEEKYPNLLKFLLRIFEKNGTGFFVGENMTLADIYFTFNLDAINTFEVDFDVSSKFPKLYELKMKVESDPKIARWIKTRPVTPS